MPTSKIWSSEGCIRHAVVAIVAAVMLCPVGSSAATLTWWATGSSGVAGGAGTWDTTNARWTESGSSWQAWDNGTLDTAVFGGTTAGTVTLSTGITAGGLTFDTTGYTVAGNTLTIAGGTANITVSSGSATIGSTVAGTSSLAKLGSGTLTLSSLNTFVGAVNVDGGTLQATAATTSQTNSALGAAGNTINVAAGATLLFNASRAAGIHTGAVNINGGTITFNSTSNILGSGATITFGTSAGTVNGSGQWQLNGAGPVVVNANASGSQINVAQLTFDNTDKVFQVADGANATDLTISSPFNNGNGNLVKTGLGSMLLSGTSSASMTVRVRAGALVAGGDAPASGNGVFGSKGDVLRVGEGSTATGTQAGDAPALLIGGPFTVGRGIWINEGTNSNAYVATLGGTNTSGTATFSGPISLQNNTGNYTLALVAAPGGTVNFANTWTFNRGTTITVGSAGNTGTVLVGGALGGSGGQLIMTNGTLVLSGSNTYTGNTTVRSGTLIAGIDAPSGAAGAFGSSGNAVIVGDASTGASTSPTILIGGTFTVGRSITVGSVANTNVYSPILGGTNTSGTATFSGGITLNTTATGYTGITLQAAPGGTVNFTGTVNTNGKAITVGSAGNSGTVLIGNTISGTSGSITMTNGTLQLSGANTYTGATTIRSGTLIAGANAPNAGNGAFGNASSALVLGDGSTAASEAPAILIGGAFTVGRAVSVGSVANSNAYSPILGGTNTSGTATFSGAVTLNTTASAYTGLTLVAAPGGTVNFTGAWTTNNKPVTIGSAGNTGTVRLGSALATIGGVTVNNGTLLVGVADAIGNTTPVAMAGGTLDLGGLADTIGSLSGSAGTVTGGAGSVLTVTQASGGTYAGVVAGSVALTKAGAGTLALTAANTFTGTTSINAGTLQIGDGGTTGALSASSAITGSTGATLAFSRTNTVTQGADFNSVIGGAVNVTQLGGGTLVLNGANTYTGATTIDAGTLVVGDGATGGAIGSTSGVAIAAGATLAFHRTDTYGGTFNRVVSGGGGLRVLSGQLTLDGSNTYSGPTIIAGGTLALTGAAALGQSAVILAGATPGGGVLDVTALGGGLSVSSGRRLGGYGTVLGDVTIAGGGIVSPGGSIGSLTSTGAATWGGGGRYLFELANANGDGSHAGSRWDLLTVSSLSITARSGSPFIIDLQSLTNPGDEAAGPLAAGNWDPDTSYQWKFLVADTTTFSAANFDPSWFSVSTSQATFPNVTNGSFSVAYGGGNGGLGGATSANELYVVYVPEPSPLALAAVGLAAVGWITRRRDD